MVDLDKVLGRGAYGTVHDATDKNGLRIAAKRIDGREEQKMEQLGFIAKKLVKLGHTNIVKMYDVLREGKTIWMFMEFCDSGDLIDYFRTRRVVHLPVSEKLKLMLDIAKGVDYLHCENVIHRDIKPGNIILSGSPSTAKLTDFDLSKFLEEPYTTSALSSNVGTLAYKAPEFFVRTTDGKLHYHRNVDIYAAGLTFLAMIQENEYLFPRIETPNEPGEASTPVGMLMWERQKYKAKPLQVVKDEDTSEVAEDGGDVWRKVRGVIKKMTQVKPEERPVAKQVVMEMGQIYCTHARSRVARAPGFSLDSSGKTTRESASEAPASTDRLVQGAHQVLQGCLQ